MVALKQTWQYLFDQLMFDTYCKVVSIIAGY